VTVGLLLLVLRIGRQKLIGPGSAELAEYAQFYSRSHDAVIRVYDEAGNVIEMHEHAGDFKESVKPLSRYSEFAARTSIIFAKY
jgi:hypothetical protein